MKILAVIALMVAMSTSALAAKKTYVYIHDRGDPFQVFAFRVEDDGNLEPLAGSPYDGKDPGGVCGGLCQTLAWSDKVDALFAGGPNGVTVMQIKKDGRLKRVAGSPFGNTASEVLGTGVIEIGKKTFVVAAEHATDQLRTFRVTGNLKLKDLEVPLATPSGPDGLSTNGNVVVLCNDTAQSLSSFTLANDGTPTASGPALPLTSSFVFNVQLAVDGRFAWQLDAVGNIFGYAVDPDTAALTSLAGNPTDSGLAIGNGGTAVSAEVLLAFQFATDGNDDVAAFRPAADGSLTPLGALQSTGLAFITAHAFSPDGSVLVVASEAVGEVRSYAVDPTTGVLSPIDSEAITATRINAVTFARR